MKDQIGNFMLQLVDFSLDTTAGGITLTGGGTTYSATSDAGNQGYGSTIVNAGTSPTPVRVLATIHGTSPPITSTSIQLVISTGIPTQNNISLAASILNMEGWTVDGVVSVVTARLVDRFQNPVPDGTAVSFWASGGHIDSSCTTTNGACSVNFFSQEKRPRKDGIDPNTGLPPVAPFPYKNGRVVVQAFAQGEESFIDLNGDGTFNHLTETFIDMPDPWLDYNEDGIYNQSEPFHDTYSAAGYSLADGCFNGVLRDYVSPDSCYSSPDFIDVRRSLTIVLSSKEASITINNDNPINLAHCVDGTPFVNAPLSFPVLITDINENIMPIDTTIAFNATNGTIIGPTSFTVGNGSPKDPAPYNVTMQSDATQDAGLTCTNSKTTGLFEVTVTAMPSKTETFATGRVND